MNTSNPQEIHSMPYFSFSRLFALLALLLASAAGMAQSLQVNAAWYGTESKNTGAVNNAAIVDKLRASVVNGVLSVPSNINVFLGGDPYPGVKKVLAVQVVHNGRVYNIRQEEGRNLVFPGTLGDTWLPAPADAPVEVAGAWYGIEGGAISNGTMALDKVRKGMVNGNVYVPADMNVFFGSDPASGKVKRVAVAVRYKGQSLNLRQTEGKALVFPGVEGVDYMVKKEVPLAEIQKYFKPDFYVLKNPDLQEAFGNNPGAAWDHYIRFGAREGRDPAPDISIAALKMRYPYLAELYGDDNAGYIHHFVASPNQFNADPSATGFADKGMFSSPKLAYLDADYYFRKNQEVCSDPEMSIPRGSSNCNGGNGVLLMNVVRVTEHFLLKGAAAGYKPNNISNANAPQSAHGKETMRAGDWLGVNEYLISRNGTFIAIMQANGDFAVYHRKPGSNPPTNGNYADVHTGVNLPASADSYFVAMQADGRLCTYRGTSPSNNKGYVACSAPEQAKGEYYLHLQSDHNLVIRAGTSMFNDRGYVWDFISTRPSKSIWSKIINPIKVLVGCN
jgi:hypothetical protein